MPTEKRHIYPAGTVNVETGNVAVKQDINYYNANTQSATRSIIRAMEDADRRFSENQIYDGLAVSNGSSTVDVASGTAKIGGRWITVDGDNLSATGLDGDYNIILHQSGVSETSTRDPSTGETTNLYLELSGSWADDDFKMVLGGATISSSTVTAVEDRGKRRTSTNIIKPYGTATSVVVYTGTKPIYNKAIEFGASSILPNLPIISLQNITGGVISGTSAYISGIVDIDGNITTGGTIQVSGTSSKVVDLSGSSLSAEDYTIGSKVLGQSEFNNLDGQDQVLKTTDTPVFNGLQLTGVLDMVANAIQGTSVNITNSILQELTNINANTISAAQWTALGGLTSNASELNQLDGVSVGGITSGDIVDIDTTQTLSKKTLLTPTIASFISGTHTHGNSAGGGVLDINNATSGVLGVAQGGLGNNDFIDGGVLLGNATSVVEVTARPTAGQILIGQASGSPSLAVLSGDVTMDATGDVSIVAQTVFPFDVFLDNDWLSEWNMGTTGLPRIKLDANDSTLQRLGASIRIPRTGIVDIYTRYNCAHTNQVDLKIWWAAIKQDSYHTGHDSGSATFNVTASVSLYWENVTLKSSYSVTEDDILGFMLSNEDTTSDIYFSTSIWLQYQ